MAQAGLDPSPPPSVSKSSTRTSRRTCTSSAGRGTAPPRRRLGPDAVRPPEAASRARRCRGSAYGVASTSSSTMIWRRFLLLLLPRMLLVLQLLRRKWLWRRDARLRARRRVLMSMISTWRRGDLQKADRNIRGQDSAILPDLRIRGGKRERRGRNEELFLSHLTSTLGFLLSSASTGVALESCVTLRPWLCVCKSIKNNITPHLHFSHSPLLCLPATSLFVFDLNTDENA